MPIEIQIGYSTFNTHFPAIALALISPLSLQTAVQHCIGSLDIKSEAEGGRRLCLDKWSVIHQRVITTGMLTSTLDRRYQYNLKWEERRC